MSSQPPEHVEETVAAKPRWYSYWPAWRRIMLTGAVILLVSSIVSAVYEERAPEWLPNVSLVLGYGFLAWGFFKAMRARGQARGDDTRWSGETKDGGKRLPASSSEEEEKKS